MNQPDPQPKSAYEVVSNPSLKIESSNSIQNNLEDHTDFKEAYQNDMVMTYTGSKPKQSTNKDAIMTLMKAYVGSGILALPYAFFQGGWLLSLIIFFISCLVLMKCVNLAIQTIENCKSNIVSLSMMTKQVYGETGSVVTRIFIISYQIGKCIAYLIFFMRFFAHVWADAEDQQNSGDFIYLVLALCIVVPMGFIDNMALFGKFSLVANVCTYLMFFSVIGNNFYLMGQTNLGENISNLADFSNSFMVMGVCVYGMGVLTVLIPLRTSLQDEKEFPRIFKVCTIVNIFGYLVFAITSVWGLGENIEQIVIFSLGQSIQASLVQVCYAFALIISYPLQLLPAFHSLEEFQIFQNFINPKVKYSRFRRLLLRFTVNILMGFIGYGVPSFAYFINILGINRSIGGAATMCLIPVLVHWKMFQNDDSKKQKKIVYVGLFGYGLVGGISSFIYSVVKLSQGIKSE